MAAPVYDDAVGWVRLDHLLDERRAADLAARCSRLADDLEDPRSGDKPSGGTRRPTALEERLPDTSAIVDDVAPVVEQILTDGWELTEFAYRCPGPGFGGQRLHADDVPKLDAGPPRCATAIVALGPFTEANGSTLVVPGSHHRIDLQRQAGVLERHPEAIHLLGPAGTGFVFNGHLLHGGGQNRSSDPRPALQLTFRARPGVVEP